MGDDHSDVSLGVAQPDLNLRCNRRDGPLSEVLNDITALVLHEGVVESELASQTAMLAAHRCARLTKMRAAARTLAVAARGACAHAHAQASKAAVELAR